MSDTMIGDWAKFGSIIRTARQRQQLSQQELAARAGVSRSWLAKVEIGHRGAEFEQVLRLVAALGMALLLREPGENPAAPGSSDPVRTALTEYLAEQEEASADRRRAWKEAADEIPDRTGRDDD